MESIIENFIILYLIIHLVYNKLKIDSCEDKISQLNDMHNDLFLKTEKLKAKNKNIMNAIENLNIEINFKFDYLECKFHEIINTIIQDNISKT